MPCSYCAGNLDEIYDEFNLTVYIEDENYLYIRIYLDGGCCNYDDGWYIKIRHCPMCGRKLEAEEDA